MSTFKQFQAIVMEQFVNEIAVDPMTSFKMKDKKLDPTKFGEKFGGSVLTDLKKKDPRSGNDLGRLIGVIEDYVDDSNTESYVKKTGGKIVITYPFIVTPPNKTMVDDNTTIMELSKFKQLQSHVSGMCSKHEYVQPAEVVPNKGYVSISFYPKRLPEEN
jgi:hypothetical protein